MSMSHVNAHTNMTIYIHSCQYTHIAQRRCTHTVMKEIYTRRQDLGEAGEGRKDHGVSVCQHRARGRLSARDRLAPHGDLQTCIRELGH